MAMTSQIPDIWRDWNRGLKSFNLSDPTMVQGSDDVIGKIISGEHRQIAFHRNFLRCAFRDVLFEGTDFSRADWKDDSFINSEFVDADLSDSSTVSCTYSGCRFVRCSFKNAAFHECLYLDCSFVECNFSSSMIRNSLVNACRYERCTTSNKLFEGCRLFSNRFEDTTLDFAAIQDNFGLDAVQLPPDHVRESRSYPEVKKFPFDANLRAPTWLRQFPPFEQLKLQYYISGGELTGGNVADEVFEPATWLSQVRAPVNLVRLLQDFGDFTIRLFDDNRIPAVFMLKLASLSHSIWQGFNNKQEHTLLSQAGAGMYLQCVRELSDLDGAISNQLAKGVPEIVTLRSFDDASDEDIAVVHHELCTVLPSVDIRITPRNSPVDLIIGHMSYGAAIFLFTLFFSTKTKIELLKLRMEAGASPVGSDPLLSVAVGGAKDVGLTSAFSLQSAMPGSLLLRIDISYSSALVERLRKAIRQAF
jgi:hypothetical protein